MSLPEFLLARIAEDQAIASKAAEMRGLREPKPAPASLWTVVDPPRGTVETTVGRVLAECEAKRRIVEDLHFDGRSGGHIAPWCSTCSDDEDLEYLPCDTLRALALPYADHPDYREEWKP